MKNNIFFAFILGVIFFIVGVWTLPSYGINWDTINHLPRGQAYLHYFITGKTDFSDLPKEVAYFQNPKSLKIDPDIPKNQVNGRSIYQIEGTNFRWQMQNDGYGHPPISDIFSAVFNRILFGQLRLINDIDSYRVYGIFLASILVGLVFYWISIVYGKFAGLVSALSLSFYPLFWAESHFNTEKDVPETVFWAFCFFCFWMGLKSGKLKWFLMSGLFLGFGLGTKFNIVFAIPILIGYFTVYFIFSKKLRFNVNILKKHFLEVIKVFLVPVVGFGVFVLGWPFLWPDPLAKIVKVVAFYKSIGTTTNYDPRFVSLFDINTFPIQWIIYTTPPLILILSIVGIIFSVKKVRKEGKYSVTALFLLWLLVPIIRVSWPGTTVYGGIRQIMEYIPALAIFSGLGAYFIVEFAKRLVRPFYLKVVILVLFSQIALMLYQIHPYENVYFNYLIGGLKGAKDANLPFWGNSFGGAYRKGIIWINENVELNAKVALARELMPNVPRIWVRRDIQFSNHYRSGYLKKGEYALGLVYQGTADHSYYDTYLEKFVEPVYQGQVDGVGVVKVWQNDESHYKNLLKEELDKSAKLKVMNFGIRIELEKKERLSRIEIDYDQEDCQEMVSGVTKMSPDGRNWSTRVGVLPKYWRIALLGQQPFNGRFIEPFAGEEMQYIEVKMEPENTCLKKVRDMKVYVFR